MLSAKYTVAVRALCEFSAKQGDLDLRFTPAPSAREGIVGHAIVAARRRGDYQAELSLEGEYGALHVRGRADGYDPAQQLLVEVKTYRGKLESIPENHRQLHRAQARIYAWLLCCKLDLPSMNVAVVYFDVDTQAETPYTEHCTADELQLYFETHCRRFLDWAMQELDHRADRDASLTALRLPHAQFRRGQRQLAEAVYNAARSARCLMAQAPTGIGKSVGTLFPMLKACPGQQIDKVFYLTARTSGRAPALDALAQMRRSSSRFPVRVVELVARDKACEHPDKACHSESCPLARGFYDRLPAARQIAIEHELLDRATLRRVALDHEICPYYLAQETVRWADVVVADYNYYFDHGGFLHALATASEWRVVVLVDEAHNLIDRARAMYTAELDRAEFDRMRRIAPQELKRPLTRLARAWSALEREQPEVYRAYAEAPAKFAAEVQGSAAAMAEWMAEHADASDPLLLDFYFDALLFARLLETLDENSQFDLSLEHAPSGKVQRSKPCVRNVIPAKFLKPRFESAHSAVLFSATLAPGDFYADTLGLPLDVVWLDVDSPFESAQLDVRIAGHISTRYADRERSLAPIADLIAEQFEAQPGNYLAFFSSFDYMEKAAEALQQRHPRLATWMQARGVDECARARFLERFRDDGQGVGFAVLGGVFGEGIDLPGARLIGAFIATLGLPQTNAVNEQMRARMEARFSSSGYDYTYFYPGLRKVVQAAGRVIRDADDRGTVVLIDDRYRRPRTRDLLPGWWKLPQTRPGDNRRVR